jgi:DNA polymerase I-like protein with 3'-5' exonuclease and polymerase domains
MSEFAFFRFMSNRMLTREEEQHKNEIIQLTEEVLDAKGLECDSRIAKISEDQLREILAEVRKLRKKRKKANDGIGVVEDEGKEPEQEEEPPYIK